ncbi:MAG: response regulator [Rhodocyclaceae bacterium]|nr:response regulator [Rhodocyclaceae bacterium]
MNARTESANAVNPPEMVGRVLVIDDDPIVAGMLAVTLGGAGHVVVERNSGEEALEYLSTGESLPDVIVIDIEMPGIDGYETCRRLKAIEATQGIPVLFLSGHDSLDDRLKAYDAGGDDFMSKPFDVQEVLRKAGVAVRHHRARHKANTDNREAFGAAMTALTSLGETGAALKFSSQALSCRTHLALAKLIIEAMGSYGLDCHVQLRRAGLSITQTVRGAASPLEESVIDKVREMGRIFSFKNRMVVNYDTVSLLIVDMPVDDADYCGRIRDHAAMIAEAAVHAVANIDARSDAMDRARELQEMNRITREAVEDLRRSYRDLQVSARIELESMVTGIEGMYHSLGLSDGQELAVSDTVRGATDRVVSLLAAGIQLDERFDGIVARLSQSAAVTIEEVTEAAPDVELW